MTLSTVEDDAMVFDSLHQAQEVSVMLLESVAKDTHIVVNGDNTSKQSVAWSNHIRKMSWDIFRLNGMSRNLWSGMKISHLSGCSRSHP